MAEIKPFKAYRYQIENPSGLGDLVSPPYDMLDKSFIDHLHDIHPNNVIRIIQNRPMPGDSANRDRHIRAARLFDDWIKCGIISKDTEPGFYTYRQIFSFDAGNKTVTYTRLGLTALVRLTPFSDGIVLPHEKTLSGPKADRLELMQETRANTELIFGLMEDDGDLYKAISGSVTNSPSGFYTDKFGVRHELGWITSPEVINRICALASGRTILIADGHHRYETSLKYASESGSPYSQYVMMTIVSMADPGLVIRPFHRLVRKNELSDKFSGARSLKSLFSLVDYGESMFSHVQDFLSGSIQNEMLFVDSSTRHSFGLDINSGGRKFLLEHNAGMSENWNSLSVSKINRLVVENLMQQPPDSTVLHDVFEYTDNADTAFKKAFSGDNFTGCFFIKPLTISTVKDIVAGGERMPQKSTNFFPKLFSGLLFNRFEL